MRHIRVLAASLILFAMLPIGLAAAHGDDCWTAGPGYTVTCGPKAHSDNDIFGNLNDTFTMFARYSQSTYGSFDWLNIALGSGWQQTGSDAQYDRVYIYQSNGGGSTTTVFYTDWWTCKRIDSIQYDELVVYPNHNATLQGTWYQRTYVNGCLQTERGVHALVVNAY